MAHLTVDEVRRVLRYEPESGRFFWRILPRYKIQVGDCAGWFDGKYWRIKLGGRLYKASRFAWLYVTGNWPISQIDHINCIKADDRFCNLRMATNAENCRNRSRRNKTGFKGVSEVRGGFVAHIMTNGVREYLGFFSTAETAKEAYNAEALKAHGQFARL